MSLCIFLATTTTVVGTCGFSFLLSTQKKNVFDLPHLTFDASNAAAEISLIFSIEREMYLKLTEMNHITHLQWPFKYIILLLLLIHTIISNSDVICTQYLFLWHICTIQFKALHCKNMQGTCIERAQTCCNCRTDTHNLVLVVFFVYLLFIWPNWYLLLTCLQLILNKINKYRKNFLWTENIKNRKQSNWQLKSHIYPRPVLCHTILYLCVCNVVPLLALCELVLSYMWLESPLTKTKVACFPLNSFAEIPF